MKWVVPGKLHKTKWHRAPMGHHHQMTEYNLSKRTDQSDSSRKRDLLSAFLSLVLVRPWTIPVPSLDPICIHYKNKRSGLDNIQTLFQLWHLGLQFFQELGCLSLCPPPLSTHTSFTPLQFLHLYASRYN